MPAGRTTLYAIWKACERIGIKPPNVQDKWEDNTPCLQAEILAFSQVRDHEDSEAFGGIVRLG